MCTGDPRLGRLITIYRVNFSVGFVCLFVFSSFSKCNLKNMKRQRMKWWHLTRRHAHAHAHVRPKQHPVSFTAGRSIKYNRDRYVLRHIGSRPQCVRLALAAAAIQINWTQHNCAFRLFISSRSRTNNRQGNDPETTASLRHFAAIHSHCIHSFIPHFSVGLGFCFAFV